MPRAVLLHVAIETGPGLNPLAITDCIKRDRRANDVLGKRCDLVAMKAFGGLWDWTRTERLRFNKEFPPGLHGVEYIVADDHAGLRQAVREVIPEAYFQRCCVHFLRNALDHLQRKGDDECRAALDLRPAAISPALRPTSPLGSRDGRRAIPSSPAGWRSRYAR